MAAKVSSIAEQVWTTSENTNLAVCDARRGHNRYASGRHQRAMVARRWQRRAVMVMTNNDDNILAVLDSVDAMDELYSDLLYAAPVSVPTPGRARVVGLRLLQGRLPLAERWSGHASRRPVVRRGHARAWFSGGR